MKKVIIGLLTIVVLSEVSCKKKDEDSSNTISATNTPLSTKVNTAAVTTTTATPSPTNKHFWSYNYGYKDTLYPRSVTVEIKGTDVIITALPLNYIRPDAFCRIHFYGSSLPIAGTYHVSGSMPLNSNDVFIELDRGRNFSTPNYLYPELVSTGKDTSNVVVSINSGKLTVTVLGSRLINHGNYEIILKAYLEQTN